MAVNGIDMITDRTILDVNNVLTLFKKGYQNMTDEEKSQFMTGLKGAYNYTDLNRVEWAVSYISDQLCDVSDELDRVSDETYVDRPQSMKLPYNKKDYTDINTKTSWTHESELTKSERERYISNVFKVIKPFFGEPNDMPNTLDSLNYNGANKIEEYLDKVLPLLYNIRDEYEKYMYSMADSWFYSNELYGGDI